MANAVIVNVATGATSTRPLTQQEQTVASADAALGVQQEQQKQAAAVRVVDASDALGQLIAQAGGANVRAKLKAVLAGTDQFTPAQRDRLLAAVALAALRDRTDS